jgi:hypothetical protein
MKYRSWRTLLTAAVVVFTVCQFSPAQGREPTDKVKKAVESGFLGDYSLLMRGTAEEAQEIYINSLTDFKQYTRIIFDPITVYVAEKSALGKLPPEQLQDCVNYLDAAVRDELSPDYEFVDQPGPDTMRLRIALTEIKGAKVVMNTVSTVMPVGLALSSVKKAATGASSAVGVARVEMELQDSMTGERLAAAVDARAGKKITGKFDKFEKYAAIYEAYDYWAKKLQQRLADLRQGNSW